MNTTAGRRPLKVAALMDTVIISGPGRQLAAVIPPLREQDVEVVPVLFHRHPRPVSAYARYLEDRGIPFVMLEESGRGDVRLLGRLDRLLRDLAPDIVQTHSYRPTTLTWLLRRWQRQPWRWVGFFHGLTNENAMVRAYHALDRRLLRGADRVIVMARPQLELFAPCATRTTVLGNAMLPDAQQATPGDAALAERLRALPRPRIAVVGRLSHEKGADIFLEAFAALTRDGVSASAVLAGDGPERQALEALASSLGIRDQVTFLGHLLSTGVVYAESEMVVLPSRSEGMPNALLEALMAGRPVVSTDVGAVPDILAVAGEDVGSMVRRGDPEALARAMRYELERQPAPGAEAGRTVVRERYSLPHRVTALRTMYDEVLSRP